MLRRRTRFPISGSALAIALVLGVGLPVVSPVVRPETAPAAEAAAAGTVALAAPSTLHANGAELSWDRYVPLSTETFDRYEVHRSATPGFAPGSTTLLTTIRDIGVTSWRDTSAKASTTFYYKVVANTAISNQVTASLPASGTSVKVLQPAGSTGKASQVVNDVSTPVVCSDARNYGASGTMRIGTSSTGWQHRGLLQFDLRDIPASANVTLAKLTLTFAPTSNPATAMSLHRLRQPWTEGSGNGTCDASGTTWLETQRSVRWKNGGTTYDGTADATLLAKSRATVTTPTPTSYLDEYTITNLAKEWVSGAAPNHGMLLKATDDTPTTTASHYFDYYSDDAGTAANRPLLRVEYTDGSAATAPRTSLVLPAAGARVGGSVAMTAAAGDDEKVAKVEFLADGAVKYTDSAAPWAGTWDASTATAGAHSLTVRATDEAGNVKTSTARSVTVDNTAAPTVTLAAPGTPTSGTYPLSATATNAASVDFLVDGELVGTDTVTPFTATWQTGGDSPIAYDGDHVLTARATDARGRVTISTPRSVTVANGTGTKYKASFDVNEPGSSTAPLAIPETFLENESADPTDPYSTTTEPTLSSSPSASYSSYASYTTVSSSQVGADGSYSVASSTQNSTTTSSQSRTQTKTQPKSGDTSRTSTTAIALPGYYTVRTLDTYSENSLKADVTVKNDSSTSWTFGGSSGLQLWYRWYIPDENAAASAGDVLLFEGNAPVYSATTVLVGGTKTIRVYVEPPTVPEGIDRALVRLRLDLYDPLATTNKWFSSRGNKPVDNPVVVAKDLKGALGLEKFWQYDSEHTGAGSSTHTNVANGNLLWRWSPFLAPGRGLASMVDLTYNSLEDHSESPAGNNFSLGMSGLSRLGYGLDIHPNRADEISGRSNKYVRVTDGDGTTHEFTGTNMPDGSVSWAEPPGVNLYLRSLGGTDPSRQWSLARPDKVTYFFDDDGYPTSVEDRNGNKLTFVLDPVDPGEDPGGPKMRVIKVTDAANRSFVIDYWSKDEAKKARVRGKIQTITDHSGSVLAFDYYDDGNLLRLTQRGGAKANGDLLADRSFVFTYTDSNGDAPAIPLKTDRANPDPKTPAQSTRLYSIRDPRGNETAFAYYTTGQLHWKLKNRWNRKGNPADTTAGCSSANHCTTFSYDLTGRRTTVDAPQSRDSEYVYDTDGKVTTLVNPLEQPTSVVWTSDFKVSQVTEPGGAVRKWTYNHNGYLTSQTDALGKRTEITYDNRALDTNDTLGHWSLIRTRTTARGVETATVGDFQWVFDYTGAAGVDGNITRVTDPEDFYSDYAWNLRGSADAGTISSSTDGNRNTTTYAYDASGQPSRITDAENQVTQMGYDLDGLMTWIQDPNHNGSTGTDVRSYRNYFDYDAFHRLGRQSAPKSTAYDRGTLVWTSAEFDENDNILRRVDAHYGGVQDDAENGTASTATYDAMDLVTLEANQENERTAYGWDSAGRLLQVTRPRGVVTTTADDFSSAYTYDVLDRVARQTDTGATSTDLRRTHMCYDIAGDLRSVTSPRAGLTTLTCSGTGPATGAYTASYDYDLAHRRTAQRDPEGHEKRTSYDANGNGKVMTQDIDKTGAPGRVTRTERFYDERDLMVRTEQQLTSTPRNVTTLMKYDGNGNKVLSAPPKAVDQAGGWANVTAGSPFVTSFKYDKVDRMVRTTLPFGPSETERQYAHRSYDANGNVAWTSLPVTEADPTVVDNADTARTTMTYFDPGWIRTSDKPTDPKVAFDYAAQSWQVERTPDKKGAPGTPDTERQMFWKFFPDGQLQERKERDGKPSTYKYDVENHLTDALDASGVTGPDDEAMVTESTYTGFGEVQEVRHRKFSASAWTFMRYTYDDNGNVTRRLENGKKDKTSLAVTEAPKEHLLSYDKADWLTEQVDLNETNLDLTTAAACKDDQWIENSFFDTGWEKKRVIHRAGAGCVADKTTWPVKTTTTWTHFDNGKLKRLETKNGSGAVTTSHDVEYLEGSRYENGNRTEDRYVLKRADGQATCTDPASPCLAQYDYDARDKLVKHVRRGSLTDSYTLDEPANLIGDKTIRAGNVTTEAKANETPVSKKYESNQLKEISVGTSPAASYLYDPYGNVDCVTLGPAGACPAGGASNLVQDYAYDELNRLASQKTYNGAPSASDTSDYTYDALDRVTKEEETHEGSAADRTTDFTHQGLSSQVTEEKQTGGSNAKTKTYSYDSYGHRISMTDKNNSTSATETFTYANDVHGSVSQLISDSGSVQSSYGYDAYGGEDSDLSSTKDPLTDTDTSPLNPYQYQSKRLDSGTATSTTNATNIDMGARRYGTDTGRFLQEDMFASALGDLGLTLDPLSQNSYALAGGNPISFVETDGHMVAADGGGGGTADPNPTDSSSDDGGDWPSLIPSVKDVIGAGVGVLSDALQDIPDEVGDEIDDGIEALAGAVSKVKPKAGRALDSFGGKVEDWVSKNGKTLGKIGEIGGGLTDLAFGALSYKNYKDEGKSNLEAGWRAGSETAVGFAAGAATAAACTGGTLGLGTPACAAIGAGVGWAAGKGMEMANEWWFDKGGQEWASQTWNDATDTASDAWNTTADAAGDAWDSASSGVSDAVSEAGEFVDDVTPW